MAEVKDQQTGSNRVLPDSSQVKTKEVVRTGLSRLSGFRVAAAISAEGDAEEQVTLFRKETPDPVTDS